nr:hypothetical protein BgiMline_013204 [Biomphalaria glabrata]
MTTEKDKCFRDLQCALKKIKESDIHTEECTNYFKKILDLFFFACEVKIKFKKEEKEIIGRLLAQNIDKILSVLLHFGYYFEPKEGPCALKYRSSLQFIVEEFKDFKIEKSLHTDENKIGVRIERSDALKTFDEAIDFWKEDLTVGLDIEGYSIEDLYKPDTIPKHHIWWIQKDSQEESSTHVEEPCPPFKSINKKEPQSPCKTLSKYKSLMRHYY